MSKEVSWPSAYDVEWEPELRGTGDVVLTFAPGGGRARGSVLVRVTHGVGTWMGQFSKGDGKIDGAYRTPSPHHVCIVVGGQGYWVNVLRPSENELIEAYPIRSVHRVADPPLMIFVDDTDVTAYGDHGKQWHTPRLASDGIEVVRADGKGIVGRAWDATLNRNVGFFIDVRTGQVEGGMLTE